MMFHLFGVLNALLTYGIFYLTMGSSGYNHIASQGRSVITLNTNNLYYCYPTEFFYT